MVTPKKSSTKAPAITKSKAAEKKKPPVSVKPAAKRPPAAAAPLTEFKLFAPAAQEVFLVGDFCNWQGDDCPMRRLKDGSWKKSLKLNQGRYEYRFVVDGHWWTDPENPQRQENPYGQDNSVLVIP
jgi:1,4-alpha-glucan branching enzyme